MSKTFKMNMGGFCTPNLSGFVSAETKEDALQQYIDHILSGANTIEIYEVNEDKVITSIHKSRIGSGEYEPLQTTGREPFETKVGDTAYLSQKIEPNNGHSLFREVA
jgi:hypothetical protein